MPDRSFRGPRPDCKYVTWMVYCKATAWMLLLPEIARTVWHCVATAWLWRLPHRIGAVRLCSVAWTIWMGDCVTAAAAALGPYDCVVMSGLWATAWLLLLLHWGRMTAFCVRDYGRLRDCCCCFIGAVWLRYVVRTMADCVNAAAAASLGSYDCVMLSGLWPTAWLLLLHWGRLTAFCVRDYGRLRDCCCCLIGAVWRRSFSGLWATAWLLLLLHWGRMTALCCLDYDRLRDCCCFIGAVWLRCVVWTMADCVTAAAASGCGHMCGLSGIRMACYIFDW